MKWATVAISVFILCAATQAAAAGARAADLAPDARRATELFNRSDDAYRNGRFKEAVDLLKEAYRLAPDPVLLYNLARAYEGLGDMPNAVESYSGYLRAAPTASDRASVERRIAALRAAIEEKARLRRERAAAELRERQAVEQASRQSSPSAVPWILAGVGGAGVAAGTVFGLIARSRNHDAAGAPQVEVSRDNSDARTFATIANVSFAIGGALLVAGVVWGLLDLRARRSHADVVLAPWIVPGASGVALRVR
jgi:tetratricopeptide (TPR) repeat protein